MHNSLPNLLLFLALSASPLLANSQTAGGEPQVLVYENGSHHQSAQTAAQNLYPTSTTVEASGTFNTVLASQAWDLVVVECPGTLPSGGWQPLVNYVNGGGVAVMSFWDWDGSANSLLLAPFELSAPSDLSMVSQTFQDSGASQVFQGVTMPISDWHTHWADDGDEFTPTGTAIGLGYLANPARPVMVLGNDGRTIATFVLDVAGDTWIGDGSSVRIWENMMTTVLEREPEFEVTSLIPGQYLTLEATRLGSDSFVAFVVSSLGPGPTVTPFGALDVTSPFRVTPRFPADESGTFNFTSTLPSGASGSTLYMQSVVFLADSTTELTNSLQVSIP
ncbi:MAG: hypothetical protein O3A95_07100 [Planctomycetota bacterium]|nr:hypothetical protein [Planctomycetota bacterium]MDA1114050.1 hypothetical protein [Planctomycetota bacterium]